MGNINHDRITLNSKEYQAVSGFECEKCAFNGALKCMTMGVKCTSDEREDGEDVIYKPVVEVKNI